MCKAFPNPSVGSLAGMMQVTIASSLSPSTWPQLLSKTMRPEWLRLPHGSQSLQKGYNSHPFYCTSASLSLLALLPLPLPPNYIKQTYKRSTLPCLSLRLPPYPSPSLLTLMASRLHTTPPRTTAGKRLVVPSLARTSLLAP